MLEQAVADGMARSLDRFSRYAPPDLARDQRAARNGWGGIGITVDGANDTFRVTAVEPQSPADRAGIRPEDQIVAIDGVTTHGCVHREVVDRLRGPVGTPISVQIVPAGMGQSRELRLQRATVFEPTVTASRDGDIGVIRVHSFNHRTTTRVAESLAALQSQAGGPPRRDRARPAQQSGRRARRGGQADRSVPAPGSGRLGRRTPSGEPAILCGLRQRAPSPMSRWSC